MYGMRPLIWSIMRQNKTNLTHFLGDSGYRSPLLSYAALYIFTAVLAICYIVFGEYGIFPDTTHYLEASDALMRGEPHIYRTPVYPLVIALVNVAVGRAACPAGVITLQWIVFLFSITYFRKTLSHIIDSRRYLFWVTAIYAIFPLFNIFNMSLLTEGLTGSFVIFFIYSLTSRLPGKPGWKNVLWSGMWLFLLIYLRPVMLCLLPVYAIFWIIVVCRWRMAAISCFCTALIVMLICCGSLLGYKHLMHEKFGINSITGVSVTNNWFMLREQDAIGPEHSDDPVVKQYLDSINGTSPWTGHALHWNEMTYLCRTLKLTIPEQEEIVDKAMASADNFYLRAAYLHLWQTNCTPFLPGYSYPAPMRYFYMALPFSTSCYVVFLICAAILLLWSVRRIAPWVFFLTSAAISGAAILGAMGGDWGRLFNPGLGAAWMLCAYLMHPALRVWRSAFRPTSDGKVS